MSVELQELIQRISEKDDKVRCSAFLELQERSKEGPDVYPYWDVFFEKLTNDNSYQRSIGLMLLAENVRWDHEGRIEGALPQYLKLLNDEKPITVRQCLRGLEKIAEESPYLHEKIVKALLSLDVSQGRESMQKLILVDILYVLAEIRKVNSTPEIEEYIRGALAGDLIDKSTKKQLIEELEMETLS